MFRAPAAGGGGVEGTVDCFFAAACGLYRKVDIWPRSISLGIAQAMQVSLSSVYVSLSESEARQILKTCFWRSDQNSRLWEE